MIDINLVPSSLRKKSSVGVFVFFPLDLPANALLGAAAGLSLLILTHVLLLLVLVFNAATLAVYKSAWHKVLPDKTAIDSLGTQVRDLKKKEKEITDITSGKAGGWSHKLNVVSDSLPQAMWLRKIVIDAAGMSIEGSVISQKQNEVNTVSTFVNNLKADALFVQDFGSVELDSIQKLRRGPTDTADFKLTAKFKITPAPPPEKK